MDNQLELLMRHSSPFTPTERGGGGGVSGGTITSPRTMAAATERNNGSPSPLRLNRPRSNPRNRTPMRYTTSPLLQQQEDLVRRRIPEHRPVPGHGITIRPTAGRAVGTILAAGNVAYRQTDGGHSSGDRRHLVATKSRKQGPSHRKVRRWNNDNFVNLAAELQSIGGGGGNRNNTGGRAAAQALLSGQADAARYRSIINPDDDHHRSKAMTQLRDDEQLREIRDQFFEGELGAKPAETPPSEKATTWLLRMEARTPDEMLLRIEPRLRRVVIKACENSVPASGVVDQVEAFLVRVHRGKRVPGDTGWWKDLLLEPPTTTHRQRDDVYITRFLFDGDAPRGGFHRLLLHGLCEFHGLKAISSSIQITIERDGIDNPVMARALLATGKIHEAGKEVKMVDTIMVRNELKGSNTQTIETMNLGQERRNSIPALKV